MMDVLTVSPEEGMPRNKAPGYRKTKVSEWQCQCNYRHQKGMQGIRLLPGLRHHQAAQHKPDEQATRVTEKNGSRVKIKYQETQIRCGEDRNCKRNPMATIDQGKGKDGNHGKQCSTRGQPVQTVDQIDGIADQHNGPHSQGKAENRAQIARQAVKADEAKSNEIKIGPACNLSCQFDTSVQSA